jgi:hypothetical protein
MSTILADKGYCVINVPDLFEEGHLVKDDACKPASAPKRKRLTRGVDTMDEKAKGKRLIDFVA